jgi:hypothetical protein
MIQKNPKKKIVIGGHSRGGAFATIAGFYLKRKGLPITVLTMGSPKVGNREFVIEYSKMLIDYSYRNVKNSDIVAHCQIGELRHVPNEIWEDSRGNYKLCHTIKTKPWVQDNSCSKRFYKTDNAESTLIFHEIFKVIKKGIKIAKKVIGKPINIIKNQFQKTINSIKDHLSYWDYENKKGLNFVC